MRPASFLATGFPRQKAIASTKLGGHIGLVHACVGKSRLTNPAFRHHREVVLHWATAIWENFPLATVLQEALAEAFALVKKHRSAWVVAGDAATVFVLTLARLGWAARSAREITTHRASSRHASPPSPCGRGTGRRSHRAVCNLEAASQTKSVPPTSFANYAKKKLARSTTGRSAAQR